MRFPLAFVISFMPATVLAQEATGSVTPDQCISRSPATFSDSVQEAQNPAVRVRADRSEAIAGETARFEGNVQLSQGQRKIRTDSAQVSSSEGTFSAEGGLLYQDAAVVIQADSLTADMEENQAELSQARYWLNGQQVHGEANKLVIAGEESLQLNGATFTTCPDDNPDWLLEAKEIEINAEEEWGKIWHAKVRLFDVPVFYVPYMTVPVSNKRKSGFLYPNISTSSKNGFDLQVPYYFNIAPNLDATLTAQYMSARGLFLQGEGRYLQPWGEGQINAEFMGSDRLVDGSPDRYLLHAEHAGKLDENWRFYGNYTTVSDDNYFNDFSSAINASTDNQISREAEAAYFTQNWNAALKVQDVEVLGDTMRPFQVMPSLSLNYFAPSLYSRLDFRFSSELTRFEHRDSHHLTATRWHLEPTLILPYQTPAGSFTTELKLNQTFYAQQDPDDELKETLSRTLPQLLMHGQINFERDLEVGGRGFLQTLEPQVQYLYIPYEDQSEIGLYDTAVLQEDYYGLFRDRRFSGLDRISDANQLTLGLATRFLDDGLRERAKLAVGQIFFFDDPKVTLSGERSDEDRSSSALAADMRLQATERWFLRGGLQYDTARGNTNKSELLVDYRLAEDKLFQLSHRYVPDLGTDVEGNAIDISQAGLRATWPVMKNTHFVGNWYYDLNLNRSIETYLGLQYESCCWAIRLAYHRHLNTNYEDQDFTTIDRRDDFDSGISLKFVLKGLGSNGPLGIGDMLDEGLFNYRKPYYLRN